MTFERIVMPVLYRWQGLQPPERPRIDATLTQDALADGRRPLPARDRGSGGRAHGGDPLGGGAGVLMSLVKADGIVTIPRPKATTPAPP